AGVARAVTIVLALSAERETVQTVGGADGVKAALAAGKEFVDVALMAHVPDEPVFWRREDAMQRDGPFHHAEVRAELAAVFGEDESAGESSRRLTDLSWSSPDAFFSSCWIFSSASASLVWQILARRVPSSKRAKSVSSGNSSDSISSTMLSSFFSASSKGRSL